MENQKTGTLYKYVSYSSRSINNLKEKRFWFSHPSNFNDPFDCRLRYGYKKHDTAVTDGVIKRLQEKDAKASNIDVNRQSAISLLSKYKSRTHFSMIKDLLNDFKLFTDDDWEWMRSNGYLHPHYDNFIKTESSLGVLALSKKRNDMLMWTHYADEHKGFCIRIETTDEQIRTAHMHPVLVHYELVPPNIIWIDDIKDRLDFLSKLNEQVGQKYKDWDYEQEVRIISQEANCLKDLPVKITGIIFGMKTPEHIKEEIKTTVSSWKEKPEFLVCAYEDGQYELDVGPAY